MQSAAPESNTVELSGREPGIASARRRVVSWTANPGGSVQLQGLDRFPLRLIDRPDHIQRGDPQQLARTIIDSGEGHGSPLGQGQLPAADQQREEYRAEVLDLAQVE